LNVPTRIAVVGLGYVGLPLAIALAHHYPVIGLDVNLDRVAALNAGHDETQEVSDTALANTKALFSSNPAEISGTDLFIVTVPTPVDADQEPDLNAVRSAVDNIGKFIEPGGTVVLESTVYPGVTEEICGPILSAQSGLICGVDFFLGYSPERMNPGDKQHSLADITKIVAGQTPSVTEMLAAVYGAVTNGNIFIAKDIRTAEAAKVIENAQRDINIAFVNEITMIFNKLGLSAYDVLDAASTKWNFLPFLPGLVGGHCIGVDPHYLAHKAQSIGHDPAIILAGRRINDEMARYVASSIDELLTAPSRILILGLTFKENVPDLRNTKVIEIISALQALGHDVDVHDPIANKAEATAAYNIDLIPSLGSSSYDVVVGAVPHASYTDFGTVDFDRLVAKDGIVADIKGMWRAVSLPAGIRRWSL